MLKSTRKTEVAPSVWAMRRKCNLMTEKIIKYKADLNMHGGKQSCGMNYFETYASVVIWFSICSLVLIADFVMAYAQVPIETNIYMELPIGIEVKIGKGDHVLKLFGQCLWAKTCRAHVEPLFSDKHFQ